MTKKVQRYTLNSFVGWSELRAVWKNSFILYTYTDALNKPWRDLICNFVSFKCYKVHNYHFNLITSSFVWIIRLCILIIKHDFVVPNNLLITTCVFS